MVFVSMLAVDYGEICPGTEVQLVSVKSRYIVMGYITTRRYVNLENRFIVEQGCYKGKSQRIIDVEFFRFSAKKQYYAIIFRLVGVQRSIGCKDNTTI